MTKLNGWTMGGAMLMLCTTAISATAQNFTKLLTFDDTDGAGPRGSLTIGKDGSLYGTTYAGGVGNPCDYCGTIFKVTPTGVLTSLHSFNGNINGGGAHPIAPLVLASDGNFYGTTVNGGINDYGVVFKMTPGGVVTTLHEFDVTDGEMPFAGLLEGTDGKLYGTTSLGGVGCNLGCGTVFEITPAGILTTIHTFDYHHGADPYSPLIQGPDGAFYGTTSVGGNLGCGAPYGCGTLFKIAAGGKFEPLFLQSPAQGIQPNGLVQGNDGNLYGTTLEGGDLTCNPPYGCGTVFRVAPGGVLTTLHVFEFTDGANPEVGLTQGSDGNFYGTTTVGGDLACTDGCGTVFQITPDEKFATLHMFNNNDGVAPRAGVMQATNGVFYGTTAGVANGYGTVFSLDMGLGPFVTFIRAAGHVGQTGGILGQGLTGTTSVMLNGIPAAFTVVSDTLIRATVPPGATTGLVTVTTPNGTLTSNVPFHVLP